MTNQRTRFFYGILFLLVLIILSMCKELYIKYNNNKNIEQVVHKENNILEIKN